MGLHCLKGRVYTGDSIYSLVNNQLNMIEFDKYFITVFTLSVHFSNISLNIVRKYHLL